jgi:pullulanase
MQQITLKNLNEYNLFSNKENILIVRALMISLHEIDVFLKTELPKHPLIQLFDSSYNQINDIQIILFEDQKKIKLSGNFKSNENYTVKIANESLNVILNPEPGGILDTVYYCEDDDFGITIMEDTVKFKVWSPPAVRIELMLFDPNECILETPYSIYLKNSKPGVWEIEINPEDHHLKSLDGYFYQYKVSAYGEQHIALDPYARSMASFNPESSDKIGKAAIVNLKSPKANPSGSEKKYSNFNHIADECDLILYEINVRDFTIQPGVVDNEIAGTYKGFKQKSSYIQELGVTHIQLMPVNNAYTQNEQNRSYTDKKSKIANYNWGYDPMNYFTLEGRYSTNPFDPYARIYEFKEMVDKMHDMGIGVILDVVFNHTYIADTFENIAPGCYYRLTREYKISGHTGAGSSLESRIKQVRKLIVDALVFFIKEYKIDGFRFDLMGFLDKDTIREIRLKAGTVYNPENPDELILHGEAWNFTDLDNNAFVKHDFDPLNIGIFNDTFRDSVSGDSRLYGFIQGNSAETGRLASGIVAGIKTFDSNNLPFNKNDFFSPYNLFAQEPKDCLNYLSIHDGLTLWDKLNLSSKGPDKKDRLNLMKFAYAVLFTSQGKIILHGGDEILRTKPLADYDIEKHRAITSDMVDEEENTIFFHENSYCSSDYTNMLRWNRLSDEYSEFAIEMFNYMKGLIKMRRSFSAFRMNTSLKINESLYFLNDVEPEQNMIHSFHSYKLQNLTLKFINGKPFETAWLTGEVHKGNPNPINNPYRLDFDEYGTAKITFNKKEIENFDLQKWENPRNLNIKLVKTAGNWDYLDYAYTNFGDNAVCPEKLNSGNEIVIDLSIVDFKSLSDNYEKTTDYIAYKIDNPAYSQRVSDSIKSFLVIHNPLNTDLQLSFISVNLENAYIILDKKNAGNSKLENSEVTIEGNTVKVPFKSTAVVAITK